MITARQGAWVAATVVFLVHALGNAHYGFFRDELYFIVCGRHPQWGYVDQPPAVPLLAALTQIGGHSLWLLRVVPALFAAGGAFVTALLVVKFGGGIFAQALATIVFLFTGLLMAFGTKVGPDEVGLTTWPLIAYLVVRIAKGGDARLWLLCGALAGLSIQSKYSVIFYLAALLAGMLLTPQRVLLRNRWFAWGAGLTFLIALPNFIWQASYHFPMWELLRNGQTGKNLIAGPLLFIVQQGLITNLFLFPVWIIGLVWLFSRADLRYLGWTYVLLILEMIVLRGKHYYAGDVYPIMIAAGAVAIEGWTARLVFARVAIAAYALLLGSLSVPDSLPILSENGYVAYRAEVRRFSHPVKGVTTETEPGRDAGALPGDWADMHGWPELAATVESIYEALPPSERVRAYVFGDNYGEASAVAFFTPQIPVISTHNQFFLWGPGGFDGGTLIQIGGTCWTKEKYFTSRTIATSIDSRWSIAYENHIPINICRGLKIEVAKLWAESKNYN
jgi:hypothetical protein